ncbi:MAG: oligosaccharide flippase family protein [Lentimicrobiaceae bacterium]|jgi:O-antigen/teichoic acid export membrane protein|nr:oligosaccharide flippase family protein [Lentimicrobiaceae bacterium]
MMKSLAGKILSSNNFLSLANNGLVAVFGFFSFILLVRILPQDVFGEWILFITAGNFIDMMRFGITRTALTRFLSGANDEEAKRLMGANYGINLTSTTIIAILLYTCYFFFRNPIQNSGFEMFFVWYPLLSFINIPFNNAQSVLQAQLKFDKMLWLRIVNVCSFMIFLIINYFMKWGIEVVLAAYLISQGFSSLLSSFLNWDGIRYVFHSTKQAVKVILDFGKYTTGTLIGSNLLKSSDTFIIGLSPFLGTTGVALYSIPLKLTEIIEIPLRSITATAFPDMSRASIKGDIPKVRDLFYKNAGVATWIMIPLMLFCFIFAKPIVYIIGGSDYLITVNIFRIFCIYGCLLPIDRFIGVTLDSINNPKYNFYKSLYMSIANIIGDLIVVFAFAYPILYASTLFLFFEGEALHTAYNIAHGFTIIKVLEGVAFITILFTLVGIFVGYNFLTKTLNLRFTDILKIGLSNGIKQIRNFTTNQ